MATLIQGGTVYAPENLGRCDLLLLGGKIARIAPHLPPEQLRSVWPDLEIVAAAGQIVVPGFIDPHVHLIGGGGESGFASRTPEVALSKVIEAGVTTVVGLLGTDGYARSVEALYAKAKGLETEGISTLMYTGSYAVPSTTITGSVPRDIMFVDKVIGVKLALSDHRSANITFDELTRLASEVRLAGMLAGKPGLVHIHTGGGKRGLELVLRVAAETDVPISLFWPTHVTRSEELFAQARNFAKLGGRIDITSYAELYPEGKIQPSKAIMQCLQDNVPSGNVTVSSDGNGSVPKYDASGNIVGIGVGTLASSLAVFRSLVTAEGLAVSDALPFFTTNAAKILALHPAKGCLREGSDADLLLLDPSLNLRTVFARGNKMLEHGSVTVKGMFET